MGKMKGQRKDAAHAAAAIAWFGMAATAWASASYPVEVKCTLCGSCSFG